MQKTLKNSATNHAFKKGFRAGEDSFQSAATFPTKMLAYIGKFLETGLYPVHLSLSLTNACQLKCAYCSQADRDMSARLEFEYLEEVLHALKHRGLEAVTFTGGGEPLLYHAFADAVGLCSNLGLKMGLVTNGIGLCGVKPLSQTLARLNWVRISVDRSREELPRVPLGLKHSFSYVWTRGSEEDPKLQILSGLAVRGKITHLRVVRDIYETGGGDAITFSPPSDTLSPIIVQNRQIYERGVKKCWVGFVHPKLDVDGMFYPCCGIQYAFEGSMERKFRKEFGLGRLDGYLKWLDAGQPFNGNICERCYYGPHNALLDGIKRQTRIEYPEFI